ncbi:MAG: hypothetical protein AB1650_08020 [Candidatus Omnitrophota bacterium]
MSNIIKHWFSGKSRQEQPDISLANIWWLPALVPLFLVLSSLISKVWAWGLMDDHAFIMSTETIWQQMVNGIQGLLKTGRFFPVYNAHAAVFYTLFHSSPKAFLIFRWFEVILTLGVWGCLAAVISRQKYAAPFFIAIALSFYKFYDAFFFLSTVEILGSLFSGLAFLLFYRSLAPVFETSRTGLKTSTIICASAFLLLSFLSKETFVAAGIALGASMIVFAALAGFKKFKNVFLLGTLILALSLVYALIMKFGISKDLTYSGDYRLTDFARINFNLRVWLNKVLVNHSPWIALTLIAFPFSAKQPSHPGLLFGRLLAFFAYFGYAIIILPWNSWGHYVTPLALFFALIITLILAPRLKTIPVSLFIILAITGLLLNTVIGGSAVNYHETYQYDTMNLQRWMAKNAVFKHEVIDNGATVRTNAFEPGYAIPRLTNMNYGKTFPDFIFTSNVREIIVDPGTLYYLYNPYSGDQNLELLGGMWSPMFVSNHWVMFRRIRYAN